MYENGFENLDETEETDSRNNSLMEEVEEECISSSSIADSSDEESNFSDCVSGDEEDDDDEFSFDRAGEPLYPGSPITVGEHILAVLSLLLRFKLTGVLLSEILSLINLHCIKPNFCVRTLYRLKKCLNNIKFP